MRLRRLKKFAPHIIILAALIGATVPTLGAQLLNEFTPTINLISVLAKPEAINLETMQIVDKEYDHVTKEYARSISNEEIEVKNTIWDIEGIYTQSEMGLKYPTNYFNPGVRVYDKTIDLSYAAPLPDQIYENEPKQSEFVPVHNLYLNISQSEDDAWNKNTAPQVDYNDNTLLLGGANSFVNNQRRIALRWDVPVPGNAKITETYVKLTHNTDASYDGFKIRIQAFDNASTAPFSDVNEDLRFSRPRYPAAWTQAPQWNDLQEPHSFTPNETVQSADISSLLQYLVDKVDWEGNESFGLLISPYQQVDSASEIIEFWSYDGATAAGKPEYIPQLVVKWEEDPANYYTISDVVDPEITVERRLDPTDYDLVVPRGVWTGGSGNLYNALLGDSFSGNNITLIVRTLTENTTSVRVSYSSSEVLVVVEYSMEEWTSMTWELGLEFDNRGDDTIIVPRANLTLNFLEDVLGEGWIGREYEIEGHDRKIVKAYLVMENNRITDTFITAVLLGEPIKFKLGFEAYILAEGANGEPMLPVVYSIELDFPFPSTTRGPFPFIHSITRAPAKANQPVLISVNASDEGTGISKRTYIYYSIDNWITQETVVMTGGTWWDYFLTDYLGDYFPIPSTFEAQTYEGEIPSFPAGTHVQYKIYIEDYANDIDHIDPGNWIWSQTYSYVVPGSGELPEDTKTFKQSIEKAFFTKFLDYIELNGLILSNYLYLQGFDTDALIPILERMSQFFYDNDIDASYTLGMILVDFDKAVDIMSDSGVSVGYLLNLFGIDFHHIWTYLIDHAILPIHSPLSLPEIAKERFDEIKIIDDLDGPILLYWNSTPSGTVSTEGTNVLNINDDDINIGAQSLNWSVSGPSVLSSNYTQLVQLFGKIDLSKNDKIVFYIDYDNHTRLNGNLEMALGDNNDKTMTSNQISFDETTYGTFQEICLSLGDFTQEPGFNISDIHHINFTYSGSEAVDVYIDYISAYSHQSYEIHKYITDTVKLRNGWAGSTADSISYFNRKIFQGLGHAGGITPSQDPVLPDWSINWYRTSGWNWLNLLATNGTYEYVDGPGPNHHMIASMLLLEYMGVPDPYKRMCDVFGVEISEPEEAFTKEEIYPYTQALGMMMVYIPLGAVAALAIVLQARRSLSKKGVREKIKKIFKR